jgi:hypothetical protein
MVESTVTRKLSLRRLAQFQRDAEAMAKAFRRLAEGKPVGKFIAVRVERTVELARELA